MHMSWMTTLHSLSCASQPVSVPSSVCLWETNIIRTQYLYRDHLLICVHSCGSVMYQPCTRVIRVCCESCYAFDTVLIYTCADEATFHRPGILIIYLSSPI